MESNVTIPGGEKHTNVADTVGEAETLSTPVFHTKHAACIAKLLGPIPKVIEFDHTRFQLKNTKQ